MQQNREYENHMLSSTDQGLLQKSFTGHEPCTETPTSKLTGSNYNSRRSIIWGRNNVRSDLIQNIIIIIKWETNFITSSL